jgi:hypothetical protein
METPPYAHNYRFLLPQPAHHPVNGPRRSDLPRLILSSRYLLPQKIRCGTQRPSALPHHTWPAPTQLPHAHVNPQVRLPPPVHRLNSPDFWGPRFSFRAQTASFGNCGFTHFPSPIPEFSEQVPEDGSELDLSHKPQFYSPQGRVGCHVSLYPPLLPLLRTRLRLLHKTAGEHIIANVRFRRLRLLG